MSSQDKLLSRAATSVVSAKTKAAQHESNRVANSLLHSKSPYLLQHAHNPVQWLEWGPAAFDLARERNRPIFLSIGYSTCHWCHVMAHESFEDEATAQILNDNFVSIKADREESSALDSAMMSFLQSSHGSGGWPANYWLTPDLLPFFASTYLPRESGSGQPSFKSILTKIARLWEEDHERCVAIAQSAVEQLKTQTLSASLSELPDATSTASKAFEYWKRRYDDKYGGFGSAPKFPSPSMTFDFLTHYSHYARNSGDKPLSESKAVGKTATEGVHATPEESHRSPADEALYMTAMTLERIAAGGINDQVASGIHRYSVDATWHVPHFEKMLYDQGQLLHSYATAAQLALTHPDEKVRGLENLFRTTAQEIITYLGRDLAHPDGAFYCAEDADSLPSKSSAHAVEGAFYVWEEDEIMAQLGADGAIFAYIFGVESAGNVPSHYDPHGELVNKNILIRRHSHADAAVKFDKSVEAIDALVEQSRLLLKRHRDETRPRPHLDDKILTSWNGLVVTGLVKAFEVLTPQGGSTAALIMAQSTIEFIKNNLVRDGILYRSFRDGVGAKGAASDYIFLIQALLDLYEAEFEVEHLTFALSLQEKLDDLFLDREHGGYFSGREDDSSIYLRIKDEQDGAEPASISIAAKNLVRLGGFFGGEKGSAFRQGAISTIKSGGEILRQAPFALGSLVNACQAFARGPVQLIVVGQLSDPLTRAFLSTIRSRFIPNRILIHLDPTLPLTDSDPLQLYNPAVRSLSGNTSPTRTTLGAHVHLCQDFACQRPITTVEALEQALDPVSRRPRVPT